MRKSVLISIFCLTFLTAPWVPYGFEVPHTPLIAYATDFPYVEEEIIFLCNELRKGHGLSPLVHNWEAARVARYKTEDMKNHNYFSHDSPVYGSFFDMLDNFRIPYKSAGENIAMGLPVPQKVVDAWAASSSHRKNILSESFTHAGVGYSTDGKVHYWALILLES